MDRDPLNVLSLCSGVGGLDLGVELATGGAARVVCHVEREAFAAAILAARMEDQTVARAPVWSDLRTFDGRPWRGVVDCVVGGYPCQPFSFAGKRGGENDPRHLWPEVARIVEETQPGIVFFENVGGHLSLGFDAVAGELHRMGYRTTAGLFTAAEVGAPHKRERLFILGVADGDERGREGERGARLPDLDAERGRDTDGRDREGRDVDDTSIERLEGLDGRAPEQMHVEERRGTLADPIGERGRSGDQRCDAADVDASGGAALADTSERDDGGRGSAGNVDTGGEADARGREEVANGPDDVRTSVVTGVFPPGPGHRAEWERILRVRPDLAPATQPRVRGVADGAAGRMDRLRALGNGVVPLAAAYAFCTLWAALEE